MNYLKLLFKTEQLRYIIKNMGRKKKQTFFTLLCIIVSSFTVFMNISLNNGLQYSLRKGINEAISGQLMIYSSEQSNINILEAQSKDQNKFIWGAEDKEKLSQNILNIQINERIRFNALVSFGEETSFLNMHALQSDHLQRISQILTLKQGSMPLQTNHLVISETMMEDLNCNIGDTLLLVADNTNGYMSDEIGIVSGIFEEKGLALFFAYTGFIPYEQGKEIVQVEDNMCLEFVLNPRSSQNISPEEIYEITEYFNTNYPELKIASWSDTVPLFHTIVNIWKGGGMITLSIFTIFSLIILITLTTLIVQSRRQEFGTLLALGFDWPKLTLIVCTEYFLINLFAITCSFLSVVGLLSFLSGNGLVIASKDLQWAFMTDKINLFLLPVNFLFIWIVFSVTTLLAVLISIKKIKKEKISYLVKTI